MYKRKSIQTLLEFFNKFFIDFKILLRNLKVSFCSTLFNSSILARIQLGDSWANNLLEKNINLLEMLWVEKCKIKNKLRVL